MKRILPNRQSGSFARDTGMGAETASGMDARMCAWMGTGTASGTDARMDARMGAGRIRIRFLQVLLTLFLAWSPGAEISAGDSSDPAGPGYVAIDEHLGTSLPSNLVFTDEDSARVTLLDLIDRPVVIAPVYYECPGLCTPIMDGMAKLFNSSDLELGKDYRVFNISFLETETPSLAADKKKNYAALLNDPAKIEYWHFMTGDSENIRDLLDALGFSVIRHGKDVLHPAAIMILDPHGKIVKYIEGTQFNPAEFKMAIQQAAAGKAMPEFAHILKLCFNYEPAGRQKVKTVTILGFILMICIAVVIVIAYPPLRNKN